MKTRFVKLLGLLTVLMVPAMLWAFWPYWHPMWWSELQPPVENAAIREAVLSSPNVANKAIHDVEVLAWSDQWAEEAHFRAKWIYLVSTARESHDGGRLWLFVYQSDDDEFFAGPAGIDDTGPLLLVAQGAIAGSQWKLSPHAWKRVTGEVLTPSTLKELQSGGFELP